MIAIRTHKNPKSWWERSGQTRKLQELFPGQDEEVAQLIERISSKQQRIVSMESVVESEQGFIKSPPGKANQAIKGRIRTASRHHICPSAPKGPTLNTRWSTSLSIGLSPVITTTATLTRVNPIAAEGLSSTDTRPLLISSTGSNAVGSRTQGSLTKFPWSTRSALTTSPWGQQILIRRRGWCFYAEEKESFEALVACCIGLGLGARQTICRFSEIQSLGFIRHSIANVAL